jgi:glycine dehydrogenase
MHTYNTATTIAHGATAAGFALLNDTWFDTVTIITPGRADAIVSAALEQGVNIRRLDADHVGITCDETTTDAHVAAVLTALGLSVPPTITGGSAITDAHRRNGEVLTHPVFRAYRTETEMLRYLRRLADRDLALDRTMIPLGSCTMKLNATTEMIPVTWPEFSDIHPFAPSSQSAGYRTLIDELERMLVEITGYDAVSLQPNAGSQGEYAGLLAIRAYHRSRGDHERQVCLVGPWHQRGERSDVRHEGRCRRL